MLIHIPFDHIKILDDGNYGCTLKMGKKIYCAVCTPDWEWIKPLYESTFDPYQNYTYIRKRDFLATSSYCYNKKLHHIDWELIDILDLRTEIMLNDFTFDIEDYISDSTNSDDDFEVTLFTVQYLNRNGNLAFELTDTLASYNIMSRAAVQFVFDLYQKSNYNTLSTIHKLGITKDSNNPITNAILKLLDIFERIYKAIDGCTQSLHRHLILNIATILLNFDLCESDLSEYTRLVYLKYIEPSISNE